tara:strand:- start:123 stop:302 length:180 start_codon:yes stop_codon:yes gene_type:complete
MSRIQKALAGNTDLLADDEKTPDHDKKVMRVLRRRSSKRLSLSQRGKLASSGSLSGLLK